MWAGEDGEARHPHSGPPPEAGAAVRGIGEAADPEAQQWRAEDSREALPGRMDRQAAEDQPRSSHSHQVRPAIMIHAGLLKGAIQSFGENAYLLSFGKWDEKMDFNLTSVP